MKKRLFYVFFMVIMAVYISGCASTGRLMDNASLKTEVRLDDTIFLNLGLPQKTVYVKATNTSDLQGIVVEPAIRERLGRKGLRIVENPSDATWVVQLNIKSFSYEKEGSGSTDGAVSGAGMGGFFGGVSAALSKSNNVGVAIGAAAGSIIGNLAGAALGAAFKVESYNGVVDLQIQEKVPGGVKGKMETDIRRGSTVMKTEREVVSDYQTYSTTLRVVARRTNINLEDAIKEMTAKIADQVAGLW